MKLRFVPVVCLLLASAEAEEVLYHRDILPILHRNCLVCHREGDVAPFSLEGYDAARRKARTMVRVCEKGFMPPWKPSPGVGDFVGEKRLTPVELSLLKRWAEQGTPEGSPSQAPQLPSLPAAGSWRLGEPDLVLTMEEAFEVPAEGPDIYRYFVLPRPRELEKDQVLVAVDFKPGDPSVVHHSDYFVDYEGKARKQKSRDGKPGFSIDETGGFFSYFGGSFLGAWAPGSDPFQLRDGLGIQLPGGGDLVMEIHYHPNGKASSDRSSVALYFAKKPVERYVNGLFLGTQDVHIRATEKNYWRHFWMELPTGIELLNIAPHMHYIGEEAHVEAILPDGGKKPLLSIEDWDLDWQTAYTYRNPVRLPEGTILHARYRFDNSDENADNPFYPARNIGWGWGTEEEMCELYLTILTDDESETGEVKLRRAELASWYRPGDQAPGIRLEAEVAMEKLIQLGGWSEEGESHLTALLGTRMGDEVLARLRQHCRKNPRDVRANIALGNLAAWYSNLEFTERGMMKLGNEADAAYSRALKREPDDWEARIGRSMLLAYSEYGPWENEGIRQLNKLLDLREGQILKAEEVRTYEVLADVHHARGEKREAEAALARGLKQFPEHPRLVHHISRR